jgi:predicted enzyme related to lactoylglutathione lyase
VNGAQVAGVVERTPEMGETPSVWSTYFEVTDVEAALAWIESLGGRVVTPVMEEAHMCFAIAEDPQGAVFGLMTTKHRA